LLFHKVGSLVKIQQIKLIGIQINKNLVGVQLFPTGLPT